MVFIDGKKTVCVKKINPFIPVIRCKKSFDKVLELPFNDSYFRVISFLVGNQKGLKRKSAISRYNIRKGGKRNGKDNP